MEEKRNLKVVKIMENKALKIYVNILREVERSTTSIKQKKKVIKISGNT